MRTCKIYCPVAACDCPYYKRDQLGLGECGIEDPMMDCDDFASVVDWEDDYEYYDEERTAFEN